jgi:glucose-6-phosphate-specific signal transduction histidine kinase
LEQLEVAGIVEGAKVVVEGREELDALCISQHLTGTKVLAYWCLLVQKYCKSTDSTSATPMVSRMLCIDLQRFLRQYLYFCTSTAKQTASK